MPVQRQRKDITPDTPGSTQEQTTPSLPNQQTFQQYLRELARAALRVVLEGVMREELDALFGVDWARETPSAKVGSGADVFLSFFGFFSSRLELLLLSIGFLASTRLASPSVSCFHPRSDPSVSQAVLCLEDVPD